MRTQRGFMRNGKKRVNVGYLTGDEQVKIKEAQEYYFKNDMTFGGNETDKTFFLGLVDLYMKGKLK